LVLQEPPLKLGGSGSYFNGQNNVSLRYSTESLDLVRTTWSWSKGTFSYYQGHSWKKKASVPKYSYLSCTHFFTDCSRTTSFYYCQCLYSNRKKECNSNNE